MNDEQRYIYDLIGAAAERTVKRLWVLIIILIMALISTNAGWLWYESQYEDVVTTQEVEAQADGDSNLNLNTVSGDYNYGGESKSTTDN